MADKSTVSHTPQWMEEALCAVPSAQPDAWFPATGQARCKATYAAIKVCGSCPVREECLEFALSDPAGAFGIWGGMTAEERAHIRRADAPRPVMTERVFRVDATGSRRRLQALMAAGYPFRWVAERVNGNPDSMRHILRQGTTAEAVAERIHEVYEEIAHLPPTPETSRDEVLIHRAKLTGSKNRWAPPEAWVGVDMDDPNASPGLVRAA